MIYKSEDELMYKAKQAEGKQFGEIDKTGRLTNSQGKGNLGQVVEESFFEYKVNSEKEADFANLGIELKVTPIKKNKNGTLSAKERLVLNIINYHEEVQNTFKTSSFWRKNQKILLMFYQWLPKIDRANYEIIKSHLHTYPEDDLAIIEQDWKIIVEKIKDGRAHELSEADTNYLAACTKGANKSSLRTQPFSSEMAMQRAFSLKQSYMTALVRKVINKEDLVKFSTTEELKNKSLYKLVNDRFKPYYGMSLDQISELENLQVNYGSKSFLQQFISTLLGIRGTKLNQIEEFSKANIKLKTVRLEPNGRPHEHMSFKNIDFDKWLNDSWQNSWVRNHFEETKFLFAVFYFKETKKQNKNRKLYFKGVRLWNMPETTIEGTLKEFWYNLKMLIADGIELTPIQQKNRTIVKNNLPKPNSNGVCHIRPKANDGKDKIALPDGRMITKQAFWLDRDYVENICKDL